MMIAAGTKLAMTASKTIPPPIPVAAERNEVAALVPTRIIAEDNSISGEIRNASMLFFVRPHIRFYD
ncbi:MAG: hypothetical protein P8M25_16540 [Paracoccaceae bacterium]|nr:hypothetical protein [Paracoccaceae bacterium]